MADPILTFVHISDTHIPVDASFDTGDFNAYAGAQALVQRINNLPFEPDFVLHTGDIAYDHDPQEYHACREILGAIKYPIYYVAGNGDDPAALQTILLQTESPRNPYYYEAEIKGVQLIVLDSNLDGNGPLKPPAGLLSDEQLTWLTALCAADDRRPLIIATHHNPQVGGMPWLDNVTSIQNTEAFHAAILPAKDRLRGVFFGHLHQNLDIYREGVLYCSTLSSWGQLHAWPGQTQIIPDPEDGPGFSVVSIYPNQTLIRRHRFVVE